MLGAGRPNRNLANYLYRIYAEPKGKHPEEASRGKTAAGPHV